MEINNNISDASLLQIVVSGRHTAIEMAERLHKQQDEEFVLWLKKDFNVKELPLPDCAGHYPSDKLEFNTFSMDSERKRLGEVLKHQIKLMRVLEQKAKCPISKIIDNL